MNISEREEQLEHALAAANEEIKYLEQEIRSLYSDLRSLDNELCYRGAE